MSTELVTTQSQPQGTLALQSDQTWWDNRQMAALQQMGVENASDGDLLVFLHVSQKTGLDPFARQIYMIGRNTKDQRTQQWVTKQTIQTGIDGFRLIARRAADRVGESLEYDDTLWADEEGNWRDVWLKKLTPPTAAKVTVLRNGRRFSAVAVYNEYVQTNRNGDPNTMWGRMPANQLAKCAEALALRKAFPQDLSGIYAEEEMGQADRPAAAPAPAATQGTGAQRMAAVLGAGDAPADQQPTASPPAEQPIAAGQPGEQPTTTVGGESPLLDMRSTLARGMFAILGEAGIQEEDQHAYLSKVLRREITSRKDLTEADARVVIDATRAALDEPFPTEQQ
jgi:phage recombination protein Bet